MSLVTSIDVSFSTSGTHSGTSDRLYLGVVTARHGGQEWNLAKEAAGHSFSSNASHHFRIGRYSGAKPSTQVRHGTISVPIDTQSDNRRPLVYLRKHGIMDAELDNAARLERIHVQLRSDPSDDPSVGSTSVEGYALLKPVWLGIEYGLTVWIPWYLT
ncbi:MAG: hypothetical protein R2754_05365 [Microthrixaceae bacterium]